MENLSSSEGARARARANHARNDAQKGCVMQLNGITLRLSLLLGDSRYIEKKLSECTSKNDEFNSLAKMTNSINCTKLRNN